MPHTLHQPLSSKFDEAMVMASRLHREQARKGTKIPYMSHILAVTAHVLEYGGTETQAIAALLHDAVEDCGGRPVLAKIQKQFGDEVTAIVESCTDSFEEGTEKRDWKERKEAYLKHLKDALPASLLVVVADKLHNLMVIERDLDQVGCDLWSRFNAPPEMQRWYYEKVIGTLKERLKNPIVHSLKHVYGRVRPRMVKTPE